MKIYTVQHDNMFGLPTLTAFDVLSETRRCYYVRQGDATITYPKESRAVYTDPALAIAAFDKMLTRVIRNLEEAIADAVKVKRSKGVEMWHYNTEGKKTRSMISRIGKVWNIEES